MFAILKFLKIFILKMDSSEKTNIVLKTKAGAGSETYKVKNNLLEVRDKVFKFNEIYQDIGQLDFFQCVVKPKLVSFLQGGEGTIFTYGASGSGKTYTMFGTIGEPGILYRSFAFLYDASKNTKAAEHSLDGVINFDESCIKTNEQDKRVLDQIHEIITRGLENPDESVDIYISMIEIYNDIIYDCLTVGKKSIKILSDGNGINTYNCLKIRVGDIWQALKTIRFGQERLNYSDTPYNCFSSRSHSLITIYMEGKKLTFCDLAGSENPNWVNNCNKTYKEGLKINESMVFLGKAIKDLSMGNKTSFRNCKLLRLLKDALIGERQLTVIVTADLSREMEKRTMLTLQFPLITCRLKMKKNQQLNTTAGMVAEMEKNPAKEQQMLRAIKAFREKYPAPSTSADAVENLPSCSKEAPLRSPDAIANLPSSSKEAPLRSPDAIANLPSSSKKTSKVNRKYNLEEDHQILRHIIESQAFGMLHQDSFYKELQSNMPQRSWKSLASRFKKNILPNLEEYDLTEAEKNHISAGWHETLGKKNSRI